MPACLRRDIELLKARLSEQIEAPYSGKCEALRKVCDVVPLDVTAVALMRLCGLRKCAILHDLCAVQARLSSDGVSRLSRAKNAAGVQEAERAHASLAALRREHGACKANSDARILHLETQLQNARLGTGAQLDALRQRATAAEDKAGVCLL